VAAAGFFRFNLSEQLAADDKLCGFVISSGNNPTSTTLQKLHLLSTDKCHLDCQHFLHLVQSKRMRARGVFASHGKGQRRVDNAHKPCDKEPEHQQKFQLARDQLASVCQRLKDKNDQLSSGVCFQRIVDKKPTKQEQPWCSFASSGNFQVKQTC